MDATRAGPVADDRLVELGELFVEGLAEDDELEELAGLIERSSEARLNLARLVDQHGALRRMLARAAEPRGRQHPGRRSRSRRQPRTWRIAAALAVAATVAFALLVPVWSTEEESNESAHASSGAIARVSAVRDEPSAVRDGRAVSLGAGDEICLGDQIESGAGSVEIAYAGEQTILNFSAHAVARIAGGRSAKRIELDRGELRAEVAPQSSSIQMTIVTPHATSTVLGTILHLAVSERTRLEVHQGVVRLVRSGDGAAVEVKAGEFAIAAVDIALEVSPIDGAEGPASRHVVDSHEEGLIWEIPRYGDPSTFRLDDTRAFAGSRSLLLSYEFRDPADGHYGYTILRHPLEVSATAERLTCRVFIVETDDDTQVNMNVVLRDRGAWFLGYSAFAKRPRGEWFEFSVPVKTARKKNSATGGDVYDPSAIEFCAISIFGGSATVFIDELTLVDGRTP